MQGADNIDELTVAELRERCERLGAELLEALAASAEAMAAPAAQADASSSQAGASAPPVTDADPARRALGLALAHAQLAGLRSAVRLFGRLAMLHSRAVVAAQTVPGAARAEAAGAEDGASAPPVAPAPPQGEGAVDPPPLDALHLLEVLRAVVRESTELCVQEGRVLDAELGDLRAAAEHAQGVSPARAPARRRHARAKP